MEEKKRGLSPTMGGIISTGAGAILSGAGALISGNANRKHAEKMQREQIAANKEAAERAYQQQREMYEMTKRDTSYSAMRKQMEDAGLNPALMYGQGGAPGVGRGDLSGGVQAAGASGAAGNIMDNPFQGVAGIGSALGLQMAVANADIKVKEAQAKNIEADTKKKEGVDTALAWQQFMKTGAEAEGQKLQNEFDQDRNFVQTMTADAQVEEVVNRVKTSAETLREAVAKADLSSAEAQGFWEKRHAELAVMYGDMLLKVSGAELNNANRIAAAQGVAIAWANNQLGRDRLEQDLKIFGEQKDQASKDRTNRLWIATINAGGSIVGDLLGMIGKRAGNAGEVVQGERGESKETRRTETWKPLEEGGWLKRIEESVESSGDYSTTKGGILVPK